LTGRGTVLDEACLRTKRDGPRIEIGIALMSQDYNGQLRFLGIRNQSPQDFETKIRQLKP
ncbi:MAG TPA: hypothetical protein VFQ02_14090, partial [Nitrospira sp.]|nr:hypothetical protein [Nitrospira sp.]